MLFWSLLFGLLMFKWCWSTYFCYTHSLWKCQLKNLFYSGDTFRCIFCMLVKENHWILPLWYLILYLSLGKFVHLLLLFPKDFEIVRVNTGVCDTIVITSGSIVSKVVWIEYYLWLNLSFRRYLVPKIPQHTSNVNTEFVGKTEWSKQLYYL